MTNPIVPEIKREGAFQIPPYSNAFGPAGRFGQHAPEGVSSAMAAEIDTVQKLTLGVAGLSSLYRLLPRGVVSTAFYPGLIPFDPLADVCAVAEDLGSP